MSQDLPDYYAGTYIKIFDQLVPLILRPEWLASQNLDFSVFVASPGIAAGAIWTGDYTIPSGETWMVYYFFVTPNLNLAAGQPAYVEIYNANTGVRFYEGPVKADEAVFIVFPKPWRNEGGQILRSNIKNLGSATGYWRVYWAGYKI